jgi:hypothetical protein
MRYMMIVKGDENFDRSGPPPQALMDAIDKLGQEATKAGKMVSFGGLRRTADGARIRLTNGKMTITDGPFTESKEVIGGFSIMNLASKDEAIEEGRKFMELHRLHWPQWNGETEIRAMFEEGDMPG